jgi:hypothetical protein
MCDPNATIRRPEFPLRCGIKMTSYLLHPRQPPFENTANWAEARRQLVDVREREVKALADLYEPPDARHVAMTNVGIVLGVGAITTNILDLGTRSQPDAMRQLMGMTGDLQVAVEITDKFTRIGVASQVQFQIENLLSNLLLADGAKPVRGFSALSRQVLTHFNYRSVNRGVNVLMVPAHIRNSLHNNGIHRNADASIQVSGYCYRFREGKQCSVAGWGHIIHTIRAELRVIERLLLLPSVRALGFVPEPYAMAVGAVPTHP